jgi:flagella basal body P-ring formation protein FlgA
MHCRAADYLLGCFGCLFLTVFAEAYPRESDPPLSDDSQAVTITLRPLVRLSALDVVLADVASLEGGDNSLRERMAAVDLAEMTIATPSVVISREQIHFRLRLAGYQDREFRVQGANLSHARLAIGTRDLPTAPTRNEAPPLQADLPVLVKAGGVIRLMARVGPVRIETLGEALQEGRAGQTVRVRNVDSQNIVSGRVVDRGVVEVDY